MISRFNVTLTDTNAKIIAHGVFFALVMIVLYLWDSPAAAMIPRPVLAVFGGIGLIGMMVSFVMWLRR